MDPGLCRKDPHLSVGAFCFVSQLPHLCQDRHVAPFRVKLLKDLEGRLHGFRAGVVGIVQDRKPSGLMDLLAVFEALARKEPPGRLLHGHAAFRADGHGRHGVHDIMLPHDV